MFLTPTSYAVTPSRKPFMRIPERASTFLRDVKRRSQRVKRSKSLVSRNKDCPLSGSFVQLNEDEVRQKYIEDVRREKEWRGEVAPAAPTSDSDDVLHSTLQLQCSCACRVHQSTPRAPFLPPSPTSTIYTPAAAGGNGYTPRQSARDITLETPKPLKLAFETSSSSPASGAGMFRKLSSPTLRDLEDKENMTPASKENLVPLTPSFSTSTRRRCTRRSSLFTPSFKKNFVHINDEVTPYKKPGTTPRPSGENKRLPVESKKAKKVGEETGQGRIIPIKQGYLYKKSGSSRMYRRKYVTLCSDGTMTYYPSFQAYVDNLHSKEIHLQHVTVKIPGQKPTGLKSTGPVAAAADSSDEGGDVKIDVVAAAEEKKPEGKTPKRKRHRLSEESAGGGEPSTLFELVIVSLDSRQWQFQLCSQEEGADWVSAIQQQIHVSLKGSGGGGGGAWEAEHNSETDCLRSIPGNEACADCGAAAPAWASLNLGTLICIECSGIHRNLGTHISKVRSLDLDSWSQANLGLMQAIGNSLANSVWEEALHCPDTSSSSLEFWNKPGPASPREEKENFIKSKYLSKNFISESIVNSQDLVNAILRNDMRSFLSVLLNLSPEMLKKSRPNPLQLALDNNHLHIAQLLVWNDADLNGIKEENGNEKSGKITQNFNQNVESKHLYPRESQLL